MRQKRMPGVLWVVGLLLAGCQGQQGGGGVYYDPSYGTIGKAASSHQCCQDAAWNTPCTAETPFREEAAFITGQDFCPNADPHGADAAPPGCP